jgi:hypothetical protein
LHGSVQDAGFTVEHFGMRQQTIPAENDMTIAPILSNSDMARCRRPLRPHTSNHNQQPQKECPTFTNRVHSDLRDGQLNGAIVAAFKVKKDY